MSAASSPERPQAAAGGHVATRGAGALVTLGRGDAGTCLDTGRNQSVFSKAPSARQSAFCLEECQFATVRDVWNQKLDEKDDAPQPPGLRGVRPHPRFKTTCPLLGCQAQVFIFLPFFIFL